MKSLSRISPPLAIAAIAVGLLISGERVASAEGEDTAPSVAEDIFQVPELDLSAPLGTRQNPVRSDMPRGEREYLMRLRCPDRTPPLFERLGSVGLSPYDNVMDIYDVWCPGSDAVSQVYMDMYHPNYREVLAVPGFSITPPM